MRTPRERARLLLPALAVALFFGIAISSLALKSATYDEPVYVIAGLSYLSLGDFRMKDDAPPLVAYLAGLSPLVLRLEIPGGRLPFEDSLQKEYPFAARLLYGADADRVLFWSRLAVLVPFGGLLLFTVHAWAGALFGPAGATLALLLAAFCPTLIAHARLVSADLPCAAAMLFASYRLWRLGEAPGAGRALGAGLALGLALVTKFSALALLPTWALVSVSWTALGPRCERMRRARQCALALAAAAAVVLAIYGWPPDPLRYARGVANIYRNLAGGYRSYFLGSFYPGVLPYYYPVVLALKLSLPLLVLGLGGLALLRRRRVGWCAALCLLLPAATLLAAATRDTAASGVRRVLPVVAVLAVAAGGWAPEVKRWGAAGARRGRAGSALLVALVGFHAFSCLRAWPHYIPYFNEVALAFGEPQDLLDDSNVDWGQDLKALPRVMRRHGVERVALWYFGKADPRYYGIDYRQMSRRDLTDPPPGVYAVSLQRIIRSRQDGVAPLFRRPPFARAGTSIWLYRVEP